MRQRLRLAVLISLAAALFGAVNVSTAGAMVCCDQVSLAQAPCDSPGASCCEARASLAHVENGKSVLIADLVRVTTSSDPHDLARLRVERPARDHEQLALSTIVLRL